MHAALRTISAYLKD